MAHRGISECPLRREDVWRSFISTILVFGIITCCPCGTVLEQTEGKAVSEDNYASIPRGCQHVVSGLEKNDQATNSSESQTQLPSYRDEFRGQIFSGVSYSGNDKMPDFEIVYSEIDLRLQHRSLALITAQEGPFSALKASQRKISFFPTSSSKTVHNDVHLVSGVLIFTTNAGSPKCRESWPMTIQLEGVFSNRTGRFCSTGCAGAPLLSADDLATFKPQKFNDLRRRLHMTPARWAYRMEHPESDSFPDTLVDMDCEVHVELNFPRAKTIKTSLVTGVMASLRSPDDPSYFHPLNISGISELPYEYDSSVQNEAEILGKSAMPDISSAARKKVEVWSSNPPFCGIPRWAYEMEFFGIHLYSPIWSSSCPSSDHRRHCSPFHNLNISRIVNSEMIIRNIECTSDLKISAAFEFEFTQYTSSPASLNDGYNETFTTIHVLVAEGLWAGFYRPGQPRAGQLVMVAHYLASDGTPLDTQIEITLRIPIVQSLYHRYGIIGHVRSTRKASDALYFPSFSFLGKFLSDMPPNLYHDSGVPIDFDESSAIFNPSYDYDSTIKPKIQPVCSLAANTHEKSHRNAWFPDGSRATELEFEVLFPFYIPRLDGSFPSGLQPFSDPYFSNRFIGQKFNAPPKSFERFDLTEHLHPPRIGIIPVSFRYKAQKDLIIDMEGYYDSAVGHLCLLGCRRRWEDMAVPYEDDGRWNLNASQIESCDMVFSIQYPPANPGLEEDLFVTGTVTSLLHTGHSLYFKPFFFSSLAPANYVMKAFCSVVRFNFEAIMSLVTLSSATFFIAVQVGCSSRKSSFKNLRYLSLAMLAILASGHLFSFLLSFNAFWNKSLPSIDTVTTSFSGFLAWVEAHNVIMRGTSIVALLLESRLLQLVWRSRTSTKSSGPITNPLLSTPASPRKVSDVAVVLTCLPIYATMILVLEFVHWILVSAKGYRYQSNYPHEIIIGAFLWAHLPAFFDTIVDLFLLPQVIANVLWDTEKKVAPLYPLFYVGMTAVRSTQHLFDALREYYTTGNPNRGLYFTEWDFMIIPFIVPCCSVFLAILLLLQQRYGGRCFIPKGLRR